MYNSFISDENTNFFPWEFFLAVYLIRRRSECSRFKKFGGLSTGNSGGLKKSGSSKETKRLEIWNM
jgi:hypothetical protein